MESAHGPYETLIAPFNGLWNSARFSFIARGPRDERKCVQARIVLLEHSLPAGEASREVLWAEPSDDVLVAVVDVPKKDASKLLYDVIDRCLMDFAKGTAADRILLRWPRPDGSPATRPDFSWYPPSRCVGPHATNQFGETRTCLAITGSGGAINEVMPWDVWQRADSNLRRRPPHIDGLNGFHANYMAGLDGTGSSNQVAQVVFPLPFELRQLEDGRLGLKAPSAAVGGGMEVILNFQPPGNPYRIAVEGGEASWEWEVLWPRGAESGKATLYYVDEEVDSIELRRWPGSGTLRSAIDAYFDPRHERLREALLGNDAKTRRGQKGGQDFEHACVRLMNLLGIPLVWYGGGQVMDRKSDAAGLASYEGKRLVLLAEFTEERPEAKFSALIGRATQLRAHLQGEAEVLPVVFTRAERSTTASEAAIKDSILLVGRRELCFLFESLSTIAGGSDPTALLSRLMSAASPGRPHIYLSW